MDAKEIRRFFGEPQSYSKQIQDFSIGGNNFLRFDLFEVFFLVYCLVVVIMRNFFLWISFVALPFW